MDKFKIALVLHASDCPQLAPKQLASMAAQLVEGVQSLLENGVARMSLYLPGPLWEAVLRERPRDLAQWKERHREGKIEFLGGGFFDPILPILPEVLRKLQIGRLSQWLADHLGARPHGFWLPAFLWESSLVETIRDCGFEFVVLKDYQMEQGVSRAKPFVGYWTQEDRGKVVGILPAQGVLSDLLRAPQPDDFLQAIAQRADDDILVVDVPLLRDGEVDDLQDTLRRIENMQLLSAEKGVELQYKCLSNLVDQYRPQGALNLPSAVGRNLGLPGHLRSCRDLLILQPECNYLHKKLLYLHRQAHKILDEKGAAQVDELLLPAQSVYWYRINGFQGGISRLRDRAHCYELLLQAERVLEDLSGESPGLQIEVLDFLANADKQILGSNSTLDLLVDHRSGGQLRSLEFKPKQVSIINGFFRSMPSPEDPMIYQVHPVSALVDHLFLPGESTLPKGVEACWEGASPLLNPLDYQLRRGADRLQIMLAGEQNASLQGKDHSFRVEKVLSFRAGSSELLVSWQYVNGTFQAYRGGIGTEWNFSFRDWEPKRQFLRVNGKRVSLLNLPAHFSEVESLDACDRSTGLRIHLDFPKTCTLLASIQTDPANAPPDSRTFQSIRLATIWETELKGQDVFSFQARLRVRGGRLGML